MYVCLYVNTNQLAWFATCPTEWVSTYGSIKWLAECVLFLGCNSFVNNTHTCTSSVLFCSSKQFDRVCCEGNCISSESVCVSEEAEFLCERPQIVPVIVTVVVYIRIANCARVIFAVYLRTLFECASYTCLNLSHEITSEYRVKTLILLFIVCVCVWCKRSKLGCQENTHTHIVLCTLLE